MIAAMVCVAAMGQPAAAAQPGRGMDFKYSGPAAELLPAFQAALGMGVEPQMLPKALPGPDGEKPVQVSVKGARVFDILAAIEKAVGKRLEFGEGWGRLQPSPLPGKVGASPGFSTADYDVVLERVEREVTYPLTWGEDGPLAAPRQSVLTLTLRAYPADAWAAERMVGFMQPGMTLTHPDGKQDAINLGPGMNMNGFSAPFVRCLRAVRQQVPVTDLPAGEYKLSGAVLMAKVDPVASRVLTAADLGRTVDLGTGAKVTVRNWAGPQQPLSWEIEGPRPDMPGMAGPGQMPMGVLGVEPLARGKSGEVLWSMGGGGGFNGTRYQGQTFWMAEPATVEFRALIVSGPEDMVSEPFEITFTLPPEFVGK